uniref:F-box/kelch-repeat protein At3g06240-like n=1 Tax=Erigeron canadensis TaxID=72917 RepID=UPI001CB8C8E8|nr:F-box/kelch-repeat protein At3g06240-like [Erigeron canadensis]
MSSCSSTSIKRVRKKPLSSATNNNISIPDDVLLSNIFFRLRAKQLAQLRSLSKTWNAHLSHPSFIQSHFDRSINTNENEILVLFCDDNHPYTEPYTAHPSASPCEDVTYLIKDPLGGITIIGSVNGLICLSNYVNHPDSFYVWNPSLSASIALPPYTKIVKCKDALKYGLSFRFGFDPKTSDYKLVKMRYIMDTLNNIIEEFLPVEVYSTQKDSWEFITEKFPSHITWVYTHNQNDEVSRRRNALGVLSRKLCVISCIRDGDCEVWVMDKYKVASSWMKIHVLSGYSGNIDPIGFTLNGKFLFGHDLRLALYDPNAAASKLFKATRTDDTLTRVALYIDNLGWPVARNVRHQL